MRVLQRANRMYFTLFLLLLSLAGLALFLIFTRISSVEVTEKLAINAKRIAKAIDEGKPVYSIPPIIEIETSALESTEGFYSRDTLLYDAMEGEDELFREVTLVREIDDQYWRITVRQVILEPHDFFNTIGITLGIAMILLFIGILLLNNLVFTRLWAPFKRNLKKVKKYSVTQTRSLELEDSNLEEFRDLNEALSKLSTQVLKDYNSLKEYTENASHEIQTPLAIIQSQLESLYQDPKITMEQFTHLEIIKGSIQKLSRLNRQLLTLMKIDNNQYVRTEDINVKAILKQQLELTTELIAAKRIKVETNWNAEPKLLVNPELFELLVSNLIRNSVLHNLENGRISISTYKASIEISNSGRPVTSPPEELFRRFRKSEPGGDSSGLGLSIVKRICEYYSWEVSYQVENGLHTLRIEF